MSIEQDAEKLARWLEANPGTPPPEGLDPEVIEAVYALRPDLAPKPRVDINDILASIQTGPLAVEDAQTEETPHMAEIIDFARLRTQEEERDARKGTGVQPTSPQRPTYDSDGPSNISPRFLLGVVGSGGLLAAAAAMFILIPAIKGGFFLQQTPQNLAMRDAAVEASEAPADDNEGIFGDAEPSTTQATPNRRSDAKEIAVPMTTVSEDKDLSDADAPPLRTRKPAQTSASEAPPIEEARSKEKAIIGITASAETSGGDDMFNDELDLEEESEPKATVAAAPPAPEMASAPEPASEMKGRDTSAGATAKSSRRLAASSVGDSNGSLSGWGAPTAPYPQDWKRPTLSTSEKATFDAAQTYLKAGDAVAAAKTLEKAIPRSQAPISQYFAATAAQYYLRAGETRSAIKVANRCVALSAQNTSFLSQCYCILGDAHKAAGDRQKAQTAYEKAARLNRKR